MYKNVLKPAVRALVAVLAAVIVSASLARCGGEPTPTLNPVPSGCLPRYEKPQWILRLHDSGGPFRYSPWPVTGDFNGDGRDDVAILPRHGAADPPPTDEIRFLLNDGSGGLYLGTRTLFSGPIPKTQNPGVLVVVAELNGDGRPDLFINDTGMDAEPYPGHQNTLLLSDHAGMLVDATETLPQLDDVAHTASAADIDGDEDTDLFIGTMLGQAMVDPYILLNDGSGTFTLTADRLPDSLRLDQNRYSASEFVDVDDDGDADLVLGAFGHDLEEEFSSPDSVVLLNDGGGSFGPEPIPLPPKPFDASDIALDIEPLDLNGDGYPDLLIAYTQQDPTYSGRYIQVLVNNQDGTFVDDTPSRLPQDDNRDPHFYRLDTWDVDEDGDADLVARPWDPSDPNPLLYLNDGAGAFSRKTHDFRVADLNYTFLDLGGDGGHDMVSATDCPPEDYFMIRDLGCTEPLD